MKKTRILTILLLIALLLTHVSALQAPTPNAAAALLIERNTGETLMEYNADEKIYPASMTKIMTCMLTLENLHLSDVVTVSESALEGLDESGSSAELQPGEQLTVEQLLYCMMLSSANEACNVAAEAVSGDIASFIGAMNRRAEELGCEKTHFANTHGLHDEAHFSTARDLSRITLEALKNREFRKIVGTSHYTVPATNLTAERHLTTTNRLIIKADNNIYYDKRVTGVKTGYTSPAGRCLIATAEDGPLSLLSIVCGCDTTILPSGDLQFESFPETEKLLDWGFSSYTYATVLTSLYPVAEIPVSRSAGSNFVSLAPKNEITSLLPIDYDEEKIELKTELISETGVSAPVNAGDELGTVTVFYRGKELGSAPLVAIAGVERATLITYLSPSRSGAQGWFRTVMLILVLAAMVVIVVLLIVRSKKRRDKKKTARQAPEKKEDAPDWFRKE